MPTAAGEFDAFLYAPIGEESDGMLLSVLSALARLNVDPWEEAARLGRLPREAATRFLISLIAALPDGSSARADPRAHAERLAALLPRRASISHPQQSGTVPPTALGVSQRDLIRYLISGTVLIALFLGGHWLMDHSNAAVPSAAAPASAEHP